MSDEVKLLPCPFCAKELRRSSNRDIWWHPGVVTDTSCPMDGRGIYGHQVAAWNTRAIEATRPTDEVAWRWLAEHKNAQVYWYGHIWGDDDREPEEWRVDLENGSINDREWATVGRGETPLAAISAAIAAMKDAASD